MAVPGIARTGHVAVRLGALGDERLARLVAQGNERAFASLYDRYHQPLYRYCRSLVRDDCDAQDVLQATFANAFGALRRGLRDAPLRPWLFRIAHNEAVSLLRRRGPDDPLPDELGSLAPSAEDAAAQRARLALLVADLRDLPERQRGALVMREMSGLSHEEVALALGISVGVAKQTVLEARRALMEFEEGRATRCAEIQRVVSDGDRRALRGRRVRAHLRECSGCAAFAAAAPARRADLLALCPALPAGAASRLFARLTASSSGHGGASVGSVALTTSKGVAAALPAKAVTAAAIATAAAGLAGVAGVAGVLPHLGTPPAPPPGRASAIRLTAGAGVAPTRAGTGATARGLPRVSNAGGPTRSRAAHGSARAGVTRAGVRSRGAHADRGGAPSRAGASGPLTLAGGTPGAGGSPAQRVGRATPGPSRTGQQHRAVAAGLRQGSVPSGPQHTKPSGHVQSVGHQPSARATPHRRAIPAAPGPRPVASAPPTTPTASANASPSADAGGGAPSGAGDGAPSGLGNASAGAGTPTAPRAQSADSAGPGSGSSGRAAN